MATLDQYVLVDWQAPRRRRGAGLRYVGVLAVWLLLAVVNPRLAWEVFVDRRSDSPIPRLRRR